MPSGVAFQIIDSTGTPADLPAEAALTGAVPFVTFAAPGDPTVKTIPQHIAGRARIARKAVADASYVATTVDAYIGISSLTAARTITLPSAGSFPPGQTLYIADESGACSSTLLITIAAAGPDTIASQPSVTMGAPYQKLAFHSNGSNLWTVA